MQIIHVVPGDLWAGAESQVYYLLRQLIKDSRCQVSVVIFNEGVLFNRLTELGVKVHLVDEGAHSSFEIAVRIARILKKESPDVLHSHEYKSHVLSSIAKLLARSGVSAIRTLHGKTAIPFNIKMLKSYVVFLLEHIILKYFTSGIIAVSADIQKALESKYGKDRIFYIPNAVSLSPDLELNQNSVRKKYNVGKRQFWLGTAARLVDVKNIDMLIDVATILHKASPGKFKVSVFGDGPDKARLRARVVSEKLDDIVSLHSHCDEVLPVLQSLDAFVLTSFHEGLPMSLLESMAVGTIPVCTRVGGMAEVIKDQVNGLLVEVNDAAHMAEAFQDLSCDGNLRQRLSSNAVISMSDEYSLSHTANEVLKLYKTASEGF